MLLENRGFEIIKMVKEHGLFRGFDLLFLDGLEEIQTRFSSFYSGSDVTWVGTPATWLVASRAELNGSFTGRVGSGVAYD